MSETAQQWRKWIQGASGRFTRSRMNADPKKREDYQALDSAYLNALERDHEELVALRGKYGNLVEHMTEILRLVRKSEGDQLSHADIVAGVANLRDQIAAAERTNTLLELDYRGWRIKAQEAESRVAALTQERDASRSALNRINDIRNSIVGTQTVNWSEHVYPLVAALNEAGLVGLEYEEAKANIGTLFQRLEAAEREYQVGRDNRNAAITRLNREKYDLSTLLDEMVAALAEAKESLNARVEAGAGWHSAWVAGDRATVASANAVLARYAAHKEKE